MLREMPPWRKLEMVVQLNQTVHELALDELQKHYPHATYDELHRHLADIMLGPELAAKVYGPLYAEPTVQIDMDEIALRVEAESIAQLLAAR